MTIKAMRYVCAAAFTFIAIGWSGPSALAAKAPPKPTTIPLSDAGQKLEARYAEMLKALKAEITAALPDVNDRAKAAYIKAIKDEDAAKKALDEAQKKLGAVGGAKGLIGHAKNYWIPKADKGIAAAKAKLSKAKTDAERDAAQKELDKWQLDREAGVKALAERTAAYEKAQQDEPKFKKDVEQAKKALADAKADMAAAMTALNIGPLTTSDRLDAKLARFVVLNEATPNGLAAFAEKGPEQQKLIDRMLADDALLLQMVVADGAADGHYARAMEIYDQIQRTSAKAKDGVLQRLALAIALEHATPIAQENPKAATDAPKNVDPIERYKHYEAAYANGELDPYFKDQTVWNLRFVVDGNEPNETLAWGREMLRNYRPDHIVTKDDRWRYVASVRTEIRYGSEENKYDKPELQSYQNILMNGGVCGRRAFFGRFILRAFGVPTIAHPQKGHAALSHWTPDGWVICLGANWGNGYTKTLYKNDFDFVATTQARALGDRFMQVKRAQWIGDVVGEKRCYGFNEKTPPAFWNGVALNIQRQLIEQAGSKTLDAVGEELGEANEGKIEYPFESPEVTEADRKISVDGKGVITIPAAATSNPTKSTRDVHFIDSVLGGKQLLGGANAEFEYTFDAPADGSYALTMNVVTPSWKQCMNLTVNGDKQPTRIELPHTVGLWQTTEPVTVKLTKGKNVLKFTRKGVKHEVAVKGFSIKEFTLTPKAGI
ncbi:MAG: hypothetical protein GC159_21165 [Phycisphaera sp.]|nr:hypothetical protein [Phycisphaera sp.]